MKTYYIDNKIPVIKLKEDYYIQSWFTIAIPELHSVGTINKTIKHPKFKVGFKQIINPTQEFISYLK